MLVWAFRPQDPTSVEDWEQRIPLIQGPVERAARSISLLKHMSGPGTVAAHVLLSGSHLTHAIRIQVKGEECNIDR